MITLWLLNDWLTTVNEAEDKECVIFLYINILIVIPTDESENVKNLQRIVLWSV